LIQQLRYEGSRLDGVLAQIHHDHGEDANIVSAELMRTGGIAGFFSREHYEVTVELADPLPEPTSTAPAARPAAIDMEPDEPLGVSPAGRKFADLLAEMIEDRVELSTSDHAEVTREPIGIPEPVEERWSDEDPMSTSVDLTSTMAGGPRSVAAILDAVNAGFRPAPPTPAEGLITIIGGRAESTRCAVALAVRMGQRASDVLVAEPGETNVSPEEMAELVIESAWQRRTRGIASVSVVVVVVPPGLAGHRWANRVLEGLNSNQVRLAVAGWRPLDRLDQTIAGLGRVDVIDLVDSDAIEDPAQLLALAVPVATIDERPATAAVWGGLLAAVPETSGATGIDPILGALR